jgi:hypothetical protein
MTDLLEIYGYHGTSQTQALSILENGFRASDNDYDWLGTGIYFFQDAPTRAKQWAIEQHPDNPAVIRAKIELENCIDLLDINWVPPLKIIYNSFVEQRIRANLPLPKQNPSKSKAHRLDCAFFNFASQVLSSRGKTLASIRAVFVEGESIFPDSAIFDLAHVQVVIKDRSLIKQYDLVNI